MCEDTKPPEQGTQSISDGTVAMLERPEEIKEEIKPDNETLPAINETLSDIGSIAWPSVTEMILTSLAGIVDQIMVGNLHPLAISAVGLTNQPKLLMQACFIAFNVGSTALIARFRGAGNQDDANRVMRQNMMFTFTMSLLISVLGFAFARPMLIFLGSNEPQTLVWAIDYLRIQMAGFVVLTLSMSVTAALRGVGNTRASMVLNTSANLINVALNYCLIYGNFGFPRMGVAGASLATVLGQLTACIGAFFILFKGNQYVYLTKHDSFRPDFSLIRRITKIGLPALGEQLCMRFGMVIFVKVVTSLGDIAFATHQICMSMMNLSFMSGQAFGVSATTLVGQSLGKRHPELAKHYAKYTGYMAQGASLLIAAALIIFRRQLVTMFIGTDVDPSINSQDIILLGSQVLIILAIIQPFQSSQLVLAGALRGAGDTRFTMITVLIFMAVMRPILSGIAVNVLHWGLTGAWLTIMLDQIGRSVLIRIHFNRGRWTKTKV